MNCCETADEGPAEGTFGVETALTDGAIAGREFSWDAADTDEENELRILSRVGSCGGVVENGRNGSRCSLTRTFRSADNIYPLLARLNKETNFNAPLFSLSWLESSE